MAHLDGRQISQPPELHGEAPSAQDLKLIVRILLDVMYLIDWRQKIPQKCDVELVPCKLISAHAVKQSLMLLLIMPLQDRTCVVCEFGNGILKVNVVVKIIPIQGISPAILKVFLDEVHFFLHNRQYVNQRHSILKKLILIQARQSTHLHER